MNEKVAKQAVADYKVRIQKLQAVAKMAQKNAAMVGSALKKKKAARATLMSAGGFTATARRQLEAADIERASTRVKDVIASLKKAADTRREHMNEKKSNSVSSAWVQSFPGMPNALKKSLWHRMHRRKQQIVLRPTEETMLNELRAKVADTVAAAQQSGGRSASKKQEILEEELLKAEQMFLLAMHPCRDEQLPTVPVTKSGESNWAEPGWHLILDVPSSAEAQSPDSSSRILPCRSNFPVLEKNLSEIASSPGRQAASLLQTSHFRCLSSPLSAFAVASSPAETGASVASGSKYGRRVSCIPARQGTI